MWATVSSPTPAIRRRAASSHSPKSPHVRICPRLSPVRDLWSKIVGSIGSSATAAIQSYLSPSRKVEAEARGSGFTGCPGGSVTDAHRPFCCRMQSWRGYPVQVWPRVWMLIRASHAVGMVPATPRRVLRRRNNAGSIRRHPVCLGSRSVWMQLQQSRDVSVAHPCLPQLLHCVGGGCEPLDCLNSEIGTRRRCGPCDCWRLRRGKRGGGCGDLGWCLTAGADAARRYVVRRSGLGGRCRPSNGESDRL